MGKNLYDFSERTDNDEYTAGAAFKDILKAIVVGILVVVVGLFISKFLLQPTAGQI